MYARLVTFKGGKVETSRLVKFYREVAVPSMQAQRGFRGGHLLIDEGSRVVTTLSLWATESDALASESSHLERLRRATAAGVVSDVIGQSVYAVAAEAPEGLAPESEEISIGVTPLEY